MAGATRFVWWVAVEGTEDRLRELVKSNLLSVDPPVGLVDVSLLEDLVDARRLVLVSRFESMAALEANTGPLQTALARLHDDLGAEAEISSYLVISAGELDEEQQDS